MSKAVTKNINNNVSVSVCPNLVHVKPTISFCKIPVKMCNMSAHPVVIKPNSLLCRLQNVNVVKKINPFKGSTAKINNANKSLKNLGISVPTNILTVNKHVKANKFFSS
jgi:hypothetical protein